MVLKKYLIGILSLVFFLSLFSINIIAQDEEMTEEEWEAEMNRLRARKQALEQEINTLRSDVDNLNTMEIKDFEECMNELYALVGATKTDVDNFRRAVSELDGKIKRKEGPKADRQTDLNALKMNKISALPEFFDKVHNQMQRSLDAWVEEPQEIMYTVVRGDHLWGIAGKPQHLGNSFAWPVIYQANRDQIKDPDLIYPNQIFKIPKLTEEEKAKYEKLRANYKPAPVQ
ncbi:MAG TPA: LysM peptidoglycan-binding domain-containing protein [Ignavibacteriaceae bacterium]|nr:LysM peptidoglycan-binding domain-containing protein [Ignavibacteriaceae bacterium]